MPLSARSAITAFSVVLVHLLPWSMARAENVLDVYDLARQNDSRFRTAQATYRADLEKLPQARATLRPTINATAQESRIDLETETESGIISRPAGDADIDRTELDLTITQPLYNGALFAGLRQARAEVRRAEAQLAAARQDLIVRVAEAYIAVLAAMDNLELAGAQKAANQRQLEVVEGRLEVGLATITDVHDARARFEFDRAEEIEALNTLRDARQGLRELTSRLITKIARLKQDAPLIEPDPPDIEKWVETALLQNLTLIASSEGVQIALEEVKRQRAGHLPTLDLVGTHNDIDDSESITGPGVEAERTEIGIQLTVPIYQGGAISSLTREAAHRYTASQQDLETQRRATERTARAAFLGVVGGTSRVLALRQAVIAAESALEAKREGFAAGINTNLDVLDAQRDLFIASRNLLRARYDYILSLLRLKESAGTLSEDDLRRFNRWLE
ncbi:MAG: TolC family outer membrane protein [Acidiferrobacterales bacterium]